MGQFWMRKKKKKKEDPDLFGKPATKKKSKPDLVKKLDRVFALYIRLRDIMPSGQGRCISCGNIKFFHELDCGHFHSRKHMSTRFDEDNCHAECIACNRASDEHLLKYRDNLIEKIGMGRFDALKLRAALPKHWMDYELEEKIEYYRKEVKRLSAEKGIHVNL